MYSRVAPDEQNEYNLSNIVGCREQSVAYLEFNILQKKG